MWRSEGVQLRGGVRGELQVRGGVSGPSSTPALHHTVPLPPPTGPPSTNRLTNFPSTLTIPPKACMRCRACSR